MEQFVNGRIIMTTAWSLVDAMITNICQSTCRLGGMVA